MNDRLKSLLAEMQRKTSFLTAVYTEVNIPFKRILITPDTSYNPGPFCLAFVLTPKGNYVVKGRVVNVQDYIDTNFSSYVSNVVQYSDKQRLNRNTFQVEKAVYSTWHAKFPDVRVSLFSPNKLHRHFKFWRRGEPEPYLKLRRIPKYWIPEFEPK